MQGLGIWNVPVGGVTPKLERHLLISLCVVTLQGKMASDTG